MKRTSAAVQHQNRFRAVLFDMDGTLTNTEELWTEALHGVALDLGGRLSPATRARMLGRSLGEVIDMLHTETGSRANPMMTRRALLGRVEDLMGAGIPWQPGARELLQSVRQAGLGTALVTSSPRRLVDIAMSTLGRDNFDYSICGDEVRTPKPDPEPYLAAMAALGLTADQCVAVEDSEPGALSAERAGLAVVVVPSAGPIPATRARTSVPSLAGQTPHSLGIATARYHAPTMLCGVA